MKRKHCGLKENMAPALSPRGESPGHQTSMGLSYQKTWQRGISNHSNVALSKIDQLDAQ